MRKTTINILPGDLIKSPGRSYRLLGGSLKNQDEFRVVLRVCRQSYEDLVEIVWLVCPSGEIKSDKYGKTATWELINSE